MATTIIARKPSLCSHHGNHASPEPYKSLYLNPLTAEHHDDKENAAPAPDGIDLVRCADNAACGGKKRPLKPTSLQLCMRANESETVEGLKIWDPPSSSMEAWEFSDTEAAPASSWSTLPNRSLLCRPLPLDVGTCTCSVVKESAQGLKGLSLYSLYTSEGQGRKDRKLAVAWHRRRSGRSEFVIAMNPKGILCRSDDSFLGTITANLMGTKYRIWDQGKSRNSLKQKTNHLLGVVEFMPTISTWSGRFRSMTAWIPKHQSMQLKNANQIQHISGLPKDWEEKKDKSYQLFSKIPLYNNVLKRYELDFREREGRTGHKIQPSVKNFQLTMEENGKQLLLQFGRIGKAKYLVEFRYPLTGYQAFCMCLTSIDSKLCCAV